MNRRTFFRRAAQVGAVVLAAPAALVAAIKTRLKPRRWLNDTEAVERYGSIFKHSCLSAPGPATIRCNCCMNEMPRSSFAGCCTQCGVVDLAWWHGLIIIDDIEEDPPPVSRKECELLFDQLELAGMLK